MDAVKRTFHYNACALALSGHFHRPIHHDIEVQAPVSLPTIGGHGSSRVENFRVKEFASFKAGYSHVSGSEHREGDKIFHTTLSTSTVEGLNILDVVTADRVVSRVSSFWTNKDDEPHFSFSGSRFENLQIAGCPVNVALKSRLISELPKFSDVDKELANNEKFRKMAQDPFQDGSAIDVKKHNGVILCSLATDMTAEAPGVTAKGHGFHVPHFGKVFLAEVLVEPWRRTLTMIRLELGSPVGGGGVVAQSGANGHTYPPPPPPTQG
jgi:hypothetical protein